MSESSQVKRKGVVHFGEQWESEGCNNQRLRATGK